MPSALVHHVNGESRETLFTDLVPQCTIPSQEPLPELLTGRAHRPQTWHTVEVMNIPLCGRR